MVIADVIFDVIAQCKRALMLKNMQSLQSSISVNVLNIKFLADTENEYVSFSWEKCKD